jgi:hypothetical protein
MKGAFNVVRELTAGEEAEMYRTTPSRTSLIISLRAATWVRICEGIRRDSIA